MSHTYNDFSLNAANDITASILAASGASRFVPSYDLSFEQLAALLEFVPPAMTEIVIHQRMPLFHTEHCLPAARLSRAHRKSECGQQCQRHRLRLRDRLGEELPVATDFACRNTVYSSAVQSAARQVPQLVKLGVRTFRVELLDESPEQAARLMALYQELLAGRITPAQVERQAADALGCRVTAGTFDQE